jgi:hypothetical protein
MLIIYERALTVDLDVTPGDAHLVLADAVVGPLVLLVPTHIHAHTVNNSTETAHGWHFYHMSQREFFFIYTVIIFFISRASIKLWSLNIILKKI